MNSWNSIKIQSFILSPSSNNRKGEFKKELKDYIKKGFIRFIIDDEYYESDNLPNLSKNNKHNIKIVVDRLQPNQNYKNRIAESIETALNLSDGVIYFHDVEKKEIIFFLKIFLSSIWLYYWRNWTKIIFF